MVLENIMKHLETKKTENKFVKIPAFFGNDINNISKPVGANVLCQNTKTNRFCYAKKTNSGRLFTGFAFDENHYQYELNSELEKNWKVIKDLSSEKISVYNHFIKYFLKIH